MEKPSLTVKDLVRSAPWAETKEMVPLVAVVVVGAGRIYMVRLNVVGPVVETYQLILAVWLQLVPLKLTCIVAGADTVNVSVFPEVILTPFCQEAVTVLTGSVPEQSV
jgi:hypothetical protein